MLTKLVVAVALMCIAAGRAEAAESDLQEIADALDVSKTKTFQFTANGSMYSLGQSTSPSAAWPRSFVKSFTRVYDFTAGAMRDDVVRMAAESPTVGPEQRAVTVVSGNMVLTDGTRSVELYQIVGNPHHDGIVMVYLRKEKLLIEADVFTPLAPGADPPKVPNPQAMNLEANVRRLSIDVDRIVPIHGRIVPYGDLLAAIGKKPAPKK